MSMFSARVRAITAIFASELIRRPSAVSLRRAVAPLLEVLCADLLADDEWIGFDQSARESGGDGGEALREKSRARVYERC